MIQRRAFHAIRIAARRRLRPQPAPPVQSIAQRHVGSMHQVRVGPQQQLLPRIVCAYPSHAFHTSRALHAQPPTADALMENLNDLYSTARDEFEIAAEETEGKTIYAADDREAAKEAFAVLKEAYDKAIRESDPQVANDVQTRTGPRIRELQNALTALEEKALED